MITEEINLGGLKIKGLIDTGATATFIPLQGRVMEHLQPY